MRGCTSLVVASLPFSEERRVPKLHRVAIEGVPVDMAEEEIMDETEAALVKRINKRDQSGILIPTMTVYWRTTTRMNYRTKFSYCGRSQDFTVHPARHQVLPLSRLRSCSPSLLQTERRMSSPRRLK